MKHTIEIFLPAWTVLSMVSAARVTSNSLAGVQQAVVEVVAFFNYNFLVWFNFVGASVASKVIFNVYIFYVLVMKLMIQKSWRKQLQVIQMLQYQNLSPQVRYFKMPAALYTVKSLTFIFGYYKMVEVNK